MRDVSVVQGGSGVRVGSHVAVAESWWSRCRGLLGRRPLRRGEGMLLLGCASVHTIGMSYPIDVAFLDEKGTVVRSLPALAPGRIGLGGPTAVHALELPAGCLARTGTALGARLTWS